MTSSSSKLLQIQGKWQQERSPTKKAKPYQKKSSSPWHCPKNWTKPLKIQRITIISLDHALTIFYELCRKHASTLSHGSASCESKHKEERVWPSTDPWTPKTCTATTPKKTGKPGQEPPRYNLRSKAQRMWPCRSPKDNPLKEQARTWGDLAGLGALWHECCTKEALAPDASRLQTCHPTCAHGSSICLAQRTRPARARWFKTA